MRPEGKKLISLVVPVFQEESVLPFFYDELAEIINEYSDSYIWEIIFINDGSTDDTLQKIRTLRSKDNRIKIISLSRNFGHQAALTAGLEHAKGDAVIMMDSDLQHPVNLIPEFIEKWKLGFDIVCAVRQIYKDQGILKRATSRCFYYLINLMSKVPIKTASADFRLMSRRAVDAFLRFGEIHRFIRGMVSWMGFKVCELPFAAEKRRAGSSKYSLKKMISFALEGITSFSTVPLRISAIFGLFICLLSFLYSLRVFIVWLIDPQKLEKGWPSLLVSMHFLGGLILISLGIIGEYIGKIYNEVKRRPIYLVQEKEGFE